MAHAISLVGLRFGRLVVESRSSLVSKNPKWECRCDCGRTTTVRGDHLRDGLSMSCGCFRRERPVTHGAYQTPEYSCWKQMRARCQNPAHHEFKNYGARGIAIDPTWSNFEQFAADMGPRPSPAHSLDRIDNDGPYAPDNCRWATLQEQSLNKRTNRLLTHGGKTLPLTAWAESVGLTPAALTSRLRYGWSVERALTEPFHH